MNRFLPILTSLFLAFPVVALAMNYSMQSFHFARDLEYYYQKAKPELLAPAIATMGRDGTLAQSDRRLFMAAFLAAIARSGKLKQADILALCQPGGADGRRLAAWAIHLADQPQKRAVLENLLKDDPTLMKQLAATAAPLEKLNPAREKAILQMYWAAFFATGDIAWPSAVIDAAIENELKRGQGLGSGANDAAASLYEYAPRHAALRKLLQKRLQTAPAGAVDMLRVILEH